MSSPLVNNIINLQNILNKINTLPEAGSSSLDSEIVAEVSTQADLISQIKTALDGKASGGSSGSTLTVGDFTYTTSPSEPGVDDFTLTSDNLHSSTRHVIIVFTKDADGYSEVWKVFSRQSLSDTFDDYLGSNDYVGNGMNSYVNEDSLEVVATSILDERFASFWYIAI